MVKYCGAEVEAILKSRLVYLYIAAVENHLGALFDPLFDPALDKLAMTFVDHRPQFRCLVVGRANLECGEPLDQFFNEFVSNLFLNHENRQGHAAFTRTPAGSVGDSGNGFFQVAVFEHQGMVFGFAQCLHAFVMARGCFVDVPADRGRTNKGNTLDVRMLQ